MRWQTKYSGWNRTFDGEKCVSWAGIGGWRPGMLIGSKIGRMGTKAVARKLPPARYQEAKIHRLRGEFDAGASAVANGSPSTCRKMIAIETALDASSSMENRCDAGLVVSNPMPNRPFPLDAPPINLPAGIATGDLIHRYYTNQEQINGGNWIAIQRSSAGMAWGPCSSAEFRAGRGAPVR